MRRAVSTPALAALVIFGAMPAPLLAQSTGLEDMIGTRAGQAEAELQRRGYRYTGGQQGDDRSFSTWWNADRRQCVTIATMNGRYDSITPTTAPDCRQPASVRPRPDYPTRPQPGFEFGRDGPPPYRPGGDRPSVLPGATIVDGQHVDLGLVCFGDGQRDVVTTGRRWEWNPRKDRYDYGLSNELTTEQFDASLTIQLWDGGGRIRLPRSLIPPLNTRGSNGWWSLDNTSVEQDSVTATYRLNGLNKPRVFINRRNGRITIDGAAGYSFRGRCDLIGNDRRKF